MKEFEPMNIVIVGGGLSGLVAAMRLQAVGHDVSLLESRRRVGGQLVSDREEGFSLDHSLQALHTGNRYVLGWITELGLADALLPLRPLQVAQIHKGRPVEIEPHRLLGVAAIPGLRKRDAARLVRWSRLMLRYAPLLDPTRPELAESLDYRSVADFVRLYYGATALSRWVAPEVQAAYSGHSESLSRVTALLTWVSRGVGRDRACVHGVPRAGLDPALNLAAEAISVRYDVEVTRIDEVARGGFSVECAARQGGKGSLEADAVIVATSAAAAASLSASCLSPAKRDFLVGVRERPAVTMSIALNGVPSRLAQLIRVPRDNSPLIEQILVEPGMDGGRAPQGCGLITLQASDAFAQENGNAPRQVVEKSLVAEFSRIFPEWAKTFRQARLEQREAAVPAFDVGAYRALARFRRAQVDQRQFGRRLYFAGDYLISPDAEGRAVSGFRAAEDLLGDVAEAPD
ncbi:MAG: FAD-dependent oxidoreductase [Myxococcota bacterium]